MTNVRGPVDYDKTKVVCTFDSPGNARDLSDAISFIESEIKARGQSIAYDNSYVVEARDDEIWVWFEYEKPADSTRRKIVLDSVELNRIVAAMNERMYSTVATMDLEVVVKFVVDQLNKKLT